MVAVQQGSMAIVMDRETYDYLYGDPAGPSPAQHDLDALIARADRLCVLDGGLVQGRPSGGRVLLELTGPTDVRSLADCLRIVEDPEEASSCPCPGGPTLELYAGVELLAMLALHHGEAIHWQRWRHDAALEDGKKLTRWLESRGVVPAVLRSIYERRDQPRAAPAGGSEKDTRAEELGTRAERHLEAGQLTEALEECDQAIRLSPDRPEGYALRANIHQRLGQLPQARADCAEAIRRGMRHAGVYFLQAVAEHAAGQHEEALASCSIALEIDREHAPAYDLRGFIRLGRGQVAAALADFGQAVRLAPGWPWFYWHRVAAYKEGGDHEGILADCTRLIQILQAALTKAPPPPPEAAGAEDDGNAEQASLLSAAHLERAAAYEAKGCLEEAERDFDASVRVAPASLMAISARGWFRARHHRTDEAMADFNEVIRLAPADPKAYLQRGTAYFQRRQYALAVADYSAALERKPDDPHAYSLRGQAHAMDGKHEEALADADEAIRLAPDQLESYWPRVRSFGAQARYGEEIAELERMLGIHPADAATCNMLAWRLATCPEAAFRDGKRAVELATRACRESEWKQPEPIDTLAAAFAETGDFQQACATEERAIRLAPSGKDTSRYSARLEKYRAGQAVRVGPQEEPAD